MLIFKLQVLSDTFWSKIPQNNHSGVAKRVVKVQLPSGKVVTFALRRRSLILLACAGAIRYPYIEGNGQTLPSGGADYNQDCGCLHIYIEKNSFR